MEAKPTGRGGTGRGQGRKKGTGTKVKVNITIDADVETWYRGLGEKPREFSNSINKALRAHMNRIEAQIRQVDQFIDEHDVPL